MMIEYGIVVDVAVSGKNLDCTRRSPEAEHPPLTPPGPTSPSSSPLLYAWSRRWRQRCPQTNPKKTAAHPKRNTATSLRLQNNVSTLNPSSPNQTKKSTSPPAQTDGTCYPPTSSSISRGRLRAPAQASFMCTRPPGRGSSTGYGSLRRKMSGRRVRGNS